MLASAATALLFGAGCGKDATEPRAAVTVDVEPSRDTMPNTTTVRIDYTVHNRGSSPLALMTCRGFTMVTVERRRSDGWQPDYHFGCPDDPLTDVVVAPAASHAASVPISMAGTYRIKVWRHPGEDSSDSFIISPGFVVR